MMPLSSSCRWRHSRRQWGANRCALPVLILSCVVLCKLGQPETWCTTRTFVECRYCSFRASAKALYSKADAELIAATARKSVAGVAQPSTTNKVARQGPGGTTVFEALLTSSEVQSVLEVAMSPEFKPQAGDSVDGLPMLTLNLMDKNQWTVIGERFRAVLDRPLKDLEKRVRELDDNTEKDLVISEVLLNGYRRGERRALSVHYDQHALVSAVCSLSAPRVGSGFYVQTDMNDRETRAFVDLKAAGDFVVHTWDVAHGVECADTEDRYSIVVWFLPRQDATTGSTSYLDTIAASGKYQGLYRLGQQREESGDLEGARSMYQKAAKQGHWQSICRLALIWRHFKNQAEGQTSEAYSAFEADKNPAAMNSAAKLMVRDGRHVEARNLLEEAAALGDLAAMNNLAMFLERGVGGPADVQRSNSLRAEVETIVQAVLPSEDGE